MSKSYNGTTIRWIYDKEDILLEYTNGVLNKRFTQASRVDEPLVMHDVVENKNYFYHSDSLGSITDVTDSTGAIVESYKYTSSGQTTIYDKDNEVVSESSIGNSYLFTGREWDSKTGLYYYRARYYDSTLGRFISADPIGFDGGINLYTYCKNSPTNYIDPFGLESFDITGNNSKTEIFTPPKGSFWWHGNYGGPGWTGGQWASCDDFTPEQQAVLPLPIDNQDYCYFEHDKCCAKCRKIKCTEGREKCFRDCDRTVSNCLRNLDRDDPSNDWNAWTADWTFRIRSSLPFNTY